MVILPFQKRTWVEINLNAVKQNFCAIREKVKSAKICCVVKANAYGHGAVELSKIYERIGADFLAVSNVEEGLQLRNAGISLPILILGYTNPECANILVNNNFSQCVFSEQYADKLAYEAEKIKVKIKIHIKIDTGMGRIGFKCRGIDDNELESAVRTCQHSCFAMEGIFTHFSSADEGKDGAQYTKEQYRNFLFSIEYFARNNIEFEICHCANSATIFDYPEMHMDMVRAGIVLYGLTPSEKVDNKIEIQPVLKLKSIVFGIKDINKGDSVSYGRTFIADKKMRIATIPIGYADGLLRMSSEHLVIEINGQKAPIIGRICMDQCMVDVSEVKDVSEGSIVTVYGDNFNKIDSVAKSNSTICYETVCSIGERVPRVYFENDTVIGITDRLITIE